MTTEYNPGTSYPYYSGGWEGSYSRHSIFTILKLSLTSNIGYHDRWLIQEIRTLQCQPAWAEYAIDMRYQDGLRTISYTTSSGGTITDTLIKGVYPTVQGEWFGSIPTTPVNWIDATILNLQSLNHYAVLDTIAASLAGSYDQIPVPVNGPNFTSSILNGTQLSWAPLEAGFTWYNTVQVFTNNSKWPTYQSKELRKYKSRTCYERRTSDFANSTQPHRHPRYPVQRQPQQLGKHGPIVPHHRTNFERYGR